MKTLLVFFAFFLLTAQTADAQFLPVQPSHEEAATEILLEKAMEYYDRCMENLYTGYGGEARSGYCACTADLARSELGMNELTLLSTGTAAIPGFDSSEFEQKINSRVAGPCLYFLIREDVYGRCISDPSTRHFFVSQDAYESMCQCLSGNMTAFMEQVGGDMVAMMMARKKPDEGKDILSAVQEWVDYTREFRSWQDQCLSTYAYK